MKEFRTLWCFASLCLLTASLAAAQEKQAAQPADLKAAAKNFVDLLSKGEFARAIKDFDSAMTKAMPEDKLRETWKSLCAEAGAFCKQTTVRQQSSGRYEIVIVTCEFKKQSLNTRVVFDKQNKITGLFFAPPTSPYQAPTYVQRSAFRESDVTVGSGDWAVPGTLAVPVGDGPFPAVVLVHGSGPTDRDETIFSNRPFRDLAWGLATQGVAVLRYDNRTKVHGAKVKAVLSTFTIKEETIDDALLAVALLRKTGKMDGKRVFVLGHSLGGICVPKIGALDTNIAGLISMAGTTRPLEEVIADQLTYILSLGGMTDEQKKQVEKMRKTAADLKGLKLTPDMLTSKMPLGMTAVYLLSLHECDPRVVVQQIKQPMLILQGERDYQATMEDFAGWKKALSGRANATFKSYPKLNHLFMEGQGKAKPEEYTKTGHVAKEVIDDLAAWIKKQ